MGLARLIREVPRAGRETPVAEAVGRLVEANAGALAVVEEGRIEGIFTERDLMRRVVHAGRDPAAVRLGEVMTSPVRTVRDATSVQEASGIMRRHHIRHLAVVDERGEYLGMIGLRYLLYDLLDDLERKVGDLETWLMADSLGG